MAESERSPRFSVVIPTMCRARSLASVLESFCEQTETSFEVIVSSDGTDGETRRLSETYTAAFPLTWIVTERQQGASIARNLGAEKARGKILLFLDDDMAPCADWLAQHGRHHSEGDDAQAVVVCGRSRHTYSRPPVSATEKYLRSERDRFESRQFADMKSLGDSLIPTHMQDYVFFGANCSIAATDFRRDGWFDPCLPMIDEDFELGSRLFARGFRFVFESRALIEHRDTKNLIEYSRRSWSISAKTDLYRVIEKKQRSGQLKAAMLLHGRNGLRGIKARFIGNHIQGARRVAEACRNISNALDSRSFFYLWRKIAIPAEYASSLKEDPQTTGSLPGIIGSPMPVLAFHSISEPRDRADSEYAMSATRFRRALELMQAWRRPSLTVEQAFGGAAPHRGVVLTFDDGYEDFYFAVFPLLKRFGIKPLVFLAAGLLGETNAWEDRSKYRSRKLMCKEQIRELYRHGVEFGSHSLTHAKLTSLSDAALRREVRDSKSVLEDLLGAEVSSFCYPYGNVDQRVRSAVGQAGYRFAFTTSAGLNFWDDLLAIKRLEVNERTTALGLGLMLSTGVSVRENLIRPIKSRLRIPMSRGYQRAVKPRITDAFVRRS